jgi:hypothetical protein
MLPKNLIHNLWDMEQAATQRVVSAAGGKKKNQRKAEYYKQAAQARRLAKVTSDPAEKVDFFEVERGWLSLARDATDEEDLVK